MSGWRLGYAVSSPHVIGMFAKLTNTALSCVPPFTQMAGIAGLQADPAERDERMQTFRKKVELLVDGVNRIDGANCLMPGGTFYVFPNVEPICRRLEITSHGLAMYLLLGADDRFGVACLGGECFGEAGRGFLRFSCAEPDERLRQAVEFLPQAFSRTNRVAVFLDQNPQYRPTAQAQASSVPRGS
jgi:aspartate aminotransferase